MTTSAELDHRKQRSNRLTAIVCGGVFFGMIGLSYAAVPLYSLFCQVTGYGGTTQRVEQYSDRILDQTMHVRFDANTNGILWDFEPVQREVEMRIGETTQIAYKATNRASRASTGKATFNVTPEMAGAYFNKVECFCFTDTTLKPGETLDMPVVFYIDPAIVDVPELKHVKTITLSYTFFQSDAEKPVAAVGATGQNTIVKTKSQFQNASRRVENGDLRASERSVRMVREHRSAEKRHLQTAITRFQIGSEKLGG